MRYCRVPEATSPALLALRRPRRFPPPRPVLLCELPALVQDAGGLKERDLLVEGSTREGLGELLRGPDPRRSLGARMRHELIWLLGLRRLCHTVRPFSPTRPPGCSQVRARRAGCGPPRRRRS